MRSDDEASGATARIPEIAARLVRWADIPEDREYLYRVKRDAEEWTNYLDEWIAILKKDPSLAEVTPCRMPLLFFSILRNDYDTIENLVCQYPLLMKQCDFRGFSPLSMAADDSEAFEILLDSATVEMMMARDLRGRTVAMSVALTGLSTNIYNITNLWDAYTPSIFEGADDQGNTCLHLACLGLVRTGGSFCNMHALCEAVSGEEWFDPNARNNEGLTALHILAIFFPDDNFEDLKRDLNDIVRLLCPRRFDFAARDDMGLTPAQYAAALRKRRVRQILRKAEKRANKLS